MLPEDIAPDDIQHPQNDDAGIDQPGNARGVYIANGKKTILPSPTR